MPFWDSSAIVPLIATQEATPRVTALARKPISMVVWWGTTIEAVSAIRRLERGTGLQESQIEEALRVLGALAERWSEVSPAERIRSRARRLLAVHPLTAADALQLAAALAWREDDGDGGEFVCLDRQLTRAASREGFTVLDGTEAR